MIPYVEDSRNILVLRLADAVRPMRRRRRCGTRWSAGSRPPSARGLRAVERAAADDEPRPDAVHRVGRRRRRRAAPAARRAGRARGRRPRSAARSPISTRTPARTWATRPARPSDCEKACYDCLLSYGNQLDHALIDRHAGPRPAAAAGRRDDGRRPSGRHAASDHARLAEAISATELERSFVGLLRRAAATGCPTTPSTVPRRRARPDFVYRMPAATSPSSSTARMHDATPYSDRDDAAEERLLDCGGRRPVPARRRLGGHRSRPTRRSSGGSGVTTVERDLRAAPWSRPGPGMGGAARAAPTTSWCSARWAAPTTRSPAVLPALEAVRPASVPAADRARPRRPRSAPAAARAPCARLPLERRPVPVAWPRSPWSRGPTSSCRC